MPEKIYALLLRLYPSQFRKEHESEAVQLFQDRLRDERGVFKRARLWCDLAADFLSGLFYAYQNSYALKDAAALTPQSPGIPRFASLRKSLSDG